MKGQTYVILCRRGYNRDICPLVQQQGLHCCECGSAGYMLREPQQKNSEKQEEEKKEESNDGE